MRNIGGAPGDLRCAWSRTERLNMFVGEGLTRKDAAFPSGHLHPSAFVLPVTSGRISSRNEAVVSASPVNIKVAMGYPSQGADSVVFASFGTGQALAGLSSSAQIQFGSSAFARLAISIQGDAPIQFSSASLLSATASLNGSSPIQFSQTLTTHAQGFMVATPISQQVTVDQIASAVWEYAVRTLTSGGGGGPSDCPTTTEIVNAIAADSRTLTVGKFIALSED